MKLTLLVNWSYSKVNLMVGWKVLQWIMNFFSFSSVPYQIKKISSINLLHRWTAVLTHTASMQDSSHPMNMHAKVGATNVPMLVPKTYTQNAESNTNRFMAKKNIMRVIRKSVGSFG